MQGREDHCFTSSTLTRDDNTRQQSVVHSQARQLNTAHLRSCTLHSCAAVTKANCARSCRSSWRGSEAQGSRTAANATA
jgi:hypothetical protein